MKSDVDQVLILRGRVARLAPHSGLLPEVEKVNLYPWNSVLHD
jgi:hypothetical protein